MVIAPSGQFTFPVQIATEGRVASIHPERAHTLAKLGQSGKPDDLGVFFASVATSGSDPPPLPSIARTPRSSFGKISIALGISGGSCGRESVRRQCKRLIAAQVWSFGEKRVCAFQQD